MVQYPTGYRVNADTLTIKQSDDIDHSFALLLFLILLHSEHGSGSKCLSGSSLLEITVDECQIGDL